MKTLTHDVEISNPNEPVYLFYLTDTHLGAKACAETLLQDDIATMSRLKKVLWIGGGDYIDAIARVGDKRYNENTLAPWLHGEHDIIDLQAARFSEAVLPIAMACVGLVQGNHEHASVRYYARDVYRQMVRDVARVALMPDEKLMLGYQGFIVLKFRHKKKLIWTMTIYCSHGYGGGRLPGGHALTMGRALGDYHADLVLMGHRHVRQYVEKTLVGPAKNGHVTKELRQGLFVPSYLDSYVQVSSKSRPVDTYPEFKGLPPQHLGTVPIRIVPGQKQVSIILSREAGLKAAIEGTNT